MDLVRKFDEEAPCDIIPIDNLQVDVPHPILRAERVYTRYGPTILFTLQGPESRRYRVYLPRRHAALVTDDDIIEINDRKAVLNLVFKGTCLNIKTDLLRLVDLSSV
jgi:hypothetical protein